MVNDSIWYFPKEDVLSMRTLLSRTPIGTQGNGIEKVYIKIKIQVLIPKVVIQ